MQNFISALLASFLSLIAGAFAQEPPTYQQHMTLAGEAFQTNDWDALNQQLDAAQEIRTYSMYVWRNRILARMLAGREDEAVALSQKAAQRGLVLNLTGHPAFETLTARDDFAPIAAMMEINSGVIGKTATYFEHQNTELLPEALTFDRKRNAYIGAVRTGEILKVNRRSNKASPLATLDGGIFDLEVRGKTVWAAVNNQLAFESADTENKVASVAVLNSKNGALVRKVTINERDALLGDIEVAKDGTVYASDSITPRIFQMTTTDEALDVFLEHPRFVNLQGIALDEKNHRLFIADYLTGLFVADLRTGNVMPISNDIDAHLGGVDGLYFYKGDLIGIQNGTSPIRIVRIGLNTEGTAAIAFDVLQQNIEGWNEPTHGAIVKDSFQYIATSNWPSYDGDWNVPDKSALKPLTIMTIDLKAKPH